MSHQIIVLRTGTRNNLVSCICNVIQRVRRITLFAQWLVMMSNHSTLGSGHQLHEVKNFSIFHCYINTQCVSACSFASRHHYAVYGKLLRIIVRIISIRIKYCCDPADVLMLNHMVHIEQFVRNAPKKYLVHTH